MAPIPRAVVGAFAFALGLSALGCNAKSRAMMPTSHFPISGAREAATVVFVRPSGFKGEDLTTIVDDHGRFLGDSIAQGYFAVRVLPGANVFISCASNTSVLRATLAPGKIYFVEVSSKIGFLSTYFDLLAIRPGARSWPRLDPWMTESAAFVPDEQAGKPAHAADIASCLRHHREELDDYSPSELARRTLSPGDGR